MTGMANSIRNDVMNVIQVKMGRRISVMPGARMFRIVTMKFTDEARDAMPAICRPTEYRTMRDTCVSTVEPAPSVSVGLGPMMFSGA